MTTRRPGELSPAIAALVTTGTFAEQQAVRLDPEVVAKRDDTTEWAIGVIRGDRSTTEVLELLREMYRHAELQSADLARNRGMRADDIRHAIRPASKADPDGHLFLAFNWLSGKFQPIELLAIFGAS